MGAEHRVGLGLLRESTQEKEKEGKKQPGKVWSLLESTFCLTPWGALEAKMLYEVAPNFRQRLVSVPLC